MKDQALEWAKHLKSKEDALHARYRDITRNLLAEKDAEDLLPMLGLDKEE